MPQEEQQPSDDEGDLEWNLGFAEPPERPADLLRHRFPSKIGGRPAWLDPVRLPSRDQLTCAAAGGPLRFLLQVYAPSDAAGPDAFHRALFVFVSDRGDRLSEPGAVRALRCQLPRRNPYYSYDPPGTGDAAPPPLKEEDAARAAAADPWGAYAAERRAAGGGAGAAGAAGSTPAAAAASFGGSGEGASGGGGSSGSGGPRLFAEYELVVEPEPEDDGGNNPEVQQALAAYRDRVAAEGEYDDDELPPDVINALEDDARGAFAMFQARCARAPEQCLRYCFQPGAQPLWPGLKRRPKPSDVPPCPGCGKARQFEFQIMPQLINFLGEDDEDPHSPDWGMIAVYSCPTSCARAGAGGPAYVEEFVWVQPAQ